MHLFFEDVRGYSRFTRKFEIDDSTLQNPVMDWRGYTREGEG